MDTTTKTELFEYHMTICRLGHELLTIKMLVEKIQEAKTISAGIDVYDKFNNFPQSLQFHVFSDDLKIRTVKDNLKILDFFGISYPSAPQGIAHLLR